MERYKYTKKTGELCRENGEIYEFSAIALTFDEPRGYNGFETPRLLLHGFEAFGDTGSDDLAVAGGRGVGVHEFGRQAFPGGGVVLDIEAAAQAFGVQQFVAFEEVAELIVEELDMPRAERELLRRARAGELPFFDDIRNALDLAMLGDQVLIG